MLDRVFRSAAILSLLTLIPTVASAEALLYPKDGLRAAIVTGGCVSRNETTVTCAVPKGHSGTVMLYGGGEAMCNFIVTNSGKSRDQWDIHARGPAHCRLEPLGNGGNVFNIWPPGK